MSELGDMFANHPLLGLAVLGILAVLAGWQIQHRAPRAGTLLRNIGYLGMVGAALLTAGLAAYRAEKSDASLALARLPEIEVQGDATRIPLDGGSHFWVRALVDGREAEFMIDTGATFTSLTGVNAEALGLAPTRGRMPVAFDTANGTAIGRFTSIASLEFGTIRARNLDAVIMVDDVGDTNVIGMNLLSQLKSWHVENGVLTLVPHKPVKN